jgi:NADH:ubiquinone oxidoreductase subunit
MEVIKQLFTWWNSQTLATRLYTWRRGEYVGTDGVGNLFYECDGSKRRWVIFNKEIDASAISAEWHGWLHHTVTFAPTLKKPLRKIWEKGHKENQTGSKSAYHPLGEDRTVVGLHSDYEAWLPEND